MKTLSPRRSILNDGLPAAASVTGSASSMTVRWFIAVSTRVTFPRSGYCVSTRWTGAARTNINRIANVCIWFLLRFKKGARRPSKTLDLLDLRVRLGGTIEVNGGPLGDSFEHHVTVSNFTSSVAEWERVNSAHAATVTKNIAVI